MTLPTMMLSSGTKRLSEGARSEWLAKLMGGRSLAPGEWKRPLAAYAGKRINLYPDDVV